MISALHHATRQVLEPFELATEPMADVEATLNAIDPKLPVFIASLASELELTPAEWRLRSVSVLLMFAATQLADDLADGDCDYLPDAGRRGPGTEWLLHQLSGALMLESSVERGTILACLTDLTQVGASQALEVRRSQWDLASSRAAAIGLNGKQWSSYLRLLADGTSHAARAPAWGEAWGSALHVAGDRTSQDRRFSSLSPADQTALTDWALKRLDDLADTNLKTLRRSAVWFRAVLQRP